MSSSRVRIKASLDRRANMNITIVRQAVGATRVRKPGVHNPKYVADRPACSEKHGGLPQAFPFVGQPTLGSEPKPL